MAPDMTAGSAFAVISVCYMDLDLGIESLRFFKDWKGEAAVPTR